MVSITWPVIATYDPRYRTVWNHIPTVAILVSEKAKYLSVYPAYLVMSRISDDVCTTQHRVDVLAAVLVGFHLT